MIQKRVPVTISEKDVVERFIKGSGPGGQAVNANHNCVQLQHRPTGATVKCHKTRYLEQNRKEARKLLLEKVDDILNPDCSLRRIRLEKSIQKNHVKRRNAKKKYQALQVAKEAEVESTQETALKQDSIVKVQ